MTLESAILAGGKNSRYAGRNKAFIQIKGRFIIDLNIAVLGELFSRISIITNSPEQFANYQTYPMAADYFKEIGPLAGIHSALKNAKSDYVFITSCDMPFLDAELVNRLQEEALLSNAAAIVPRHGKSVEPLFAFYHIGLLDKLENHIKHDSKRSIHGFLAQIQVVYVDFESDEKTKKAFININRPEDLAQL